MEKPLVESKELTDLFGQPENNPNFKPDGFFFTGFGLALLEDGCCFYPLYAVLAPCGLDSKYRVLNGKDLIDPSGKRIGFFNGDSLFDTECRDTNYFLNNGRIWYAPEAFLQAQKAEQDKREKEQAEMLFLD